jgi:hypothetical protein
MGLEFFFSAAANLYPEMSSELLSHIEETSKDTPLRVQVEAQVCKKKTD